jgi:hypothetical protein
MIDLIGVDSQMIAAAGYDPNARILIVLFNNGKAYEYYNVSQDVYEGLMAAESKGQYMRENVIDAYPYAVFRGWKKNRMQA